MSKGTAAIGMYGAVTFGGYLCVPVSQWHYLRGSPVKWCIMMWLCDRMWCHHNQHTQIFQTSRYHHMLCVYLWSLPVHTCTTMVLPHLWEGALWCDFMIGCDDTITSICRFIQWSGYHHMLCVHLWSLPVHTCTTMALPPPYDNHMGMMYRIVADSAFVLPW